MTLQELRLNAGLSLAQAHQRYKEVSPKSAPKTRNALVQWERRGTDSLSVMRTLAQVYGQPLEVVEAASEATRATARTNGALSPVAA